MLPDGSGSPQFRTIDEEARDMYINRTGCMEYFESIIKLADPFLLVRARDLTGNYGEQDDLRQDTWIRFIESDPDLTKFRLCGWLCKVMHNIHIDRFREGQRQPRTKSLNEALDGGSHMHPAKAKEWLVKDLVHNALAKLHPVANAAICLSLEEGCNQAEIAARLHLPISTIQYHVSVGKKMLLRDPQIIELMKELANKRRKECV